MKSNIKIKTKINIKILWKDQKAKYIFVNIIIFLMMTNMSYWWVSFFYFISLQWKIGILVWEILNNNKENLDIKE